MSMTTSDHHKMSFSTFSFLLRSVELVNEILNQFNLCVPEESWCHAQSNTEQDFHETVKAARKTAWDWIEELISIMEDKHVGKKTTKIQVNKTLLKVAHA